MKLFVLALFGLSAASLAWAQDAPPLTGKDARTTIHESTKLPNTRHYYPAAAQQQGVAGKASALCTVAANGDLVDCSVQSETPEGYGFGEAAVGLATNVVRIAPKAKDGSPTVGRKYRFDLTFRLP